jgi:hypothetical protein
MFGECSFYIHIMDPLIYLGIIVLWGDISRSAYTPSVGGFPIQEWVVLALHHISRESSRKEWLEQARQSYEE